MEQLIYYSNIMNVQEVQLLSLASSITFLFIFICKTIYNCCKTLPNMDPLVLEGLVSQYYKIKKNNEDTKKVVDEVSLKTMTCLVKLDHISKHLNI